MKNLHLAIHNGKALSFCKKITLLLTLSFSAASSYSFTNGTLLQYFDSDSNADGQHWVRVKGAASSWSTKGITAFWLPPAYKGSAGSQDVGYGVYDLFDLGEFQNRGEPTGTVRTRWGTLDQYIKAIDAAHDAGVQVYGDIVLNHMTGGDTTELATMVRVDQNNRNIEYWGDFSAHVYTGFNFPNRKQANGTLKYNNFKWHWYHFDGVDWTLELGKDGCNDCRIYKFRGAGKSWDPEVSNEKGNYDYLLGSDLDFQHPEVRNHLKDWGVWYTKMAKLDGFRIDATKHISSSYFNDWLYHVRQTTGKTNAFAVSEYWEYDIGKLDNYVNSVNGNINDKMSAFDVPLHGHFSTASNQNAANPYNMQYLFSDTLVARQPTRTVTIVDNHDTLNGRSLASQVQDWFKPLAYASILLRQDGYPTVFLGDYEGVPGKVANHSWIIDQLLKSRKNHAYGKQNDYFDNQDIVGWTREGDSEHWYGLAVLINDNRSTSGGKWMYVGNAHANQCFSDVTNSVTTQVCANNNAWAYFTVPAGKVTVWIRTGKFGRNTH
jgi:alpha-amylase